MTQMDLFQKQTQDEQSLLPVTHVNHFHLPGSEVAARMTGISGRTFFPLLKPDDRLSAFSKMFMATSHWASTKCFLTWSVRPTPQGRSLYQLVPSTHHTDETDSGLSQKMWPTPTASDSSYSPKNRFMGSETYRSNLCEAVRENQHSAHLNPDWVEWLMGYPSGWTNLQTSPEPPAQQKDAPQGSKD